MPVPPCREEAPRGLERQLKEVLKSSGNSSRLLAEGGLTYHGINLAQPLPSSNR